MEKSLNEGCPSKKGQDKVYVIILHFPSKNLWTKPHTLLRADLWFSLAFLFFFSLMMKRLERKGGKATLLFVY